LHQNLLKNTLAEKYNSSKNVSNLFIADNDLLVTHHLEYPADLYPLKM